MPNKLPYFGMFFFCLHLYLGLLMVQKLVKVQGQRNLHYSLSFLIIRRVWPIPPKKQVNVYKYVGNYMFVYIIN